MGRCGRDLHAADTCSKALLDSGLSGGGTPRAAPNVAAARPPGARTDLRLRLNISYQRRGVRPGDK